ncbi:AAA family ATPase [Streptomyces sp. McG3]|uniref:AAA family ATPase n=1 Tax=Streptomyces sp. McG3 TaxID=2725483 RepID=UPI001BEC36CF|nr:AAA family ATPase [Streptomyces sp. McG3]MBT2896390.1 AAA family ATPase [Streptomyces sp. McG3]
MLDSDGASLRELANSSKKEGHGVMSTRRHSIVHGVLLEGINYSGKSTVARLLGEKLAMRGHVPRQRHCYAVESSISQELQRQAFESVQNWEDRAFPDADLMRAFNIRKSAQILVDSGLIAESDAGADADAESVIVQDRHWFTQYCSNEFFNPGEGLLSKPWLRQHAPRFTVQVYLTCSQEERLRRASQRTGPEKHNLNSYQRAHLTELASYDAFCKSLIRNDPAWQIIQTDSVGADVVADTILAVFNAATASGTEDLQEAESRA